MTKKPTGRRKKETSPAVLAALQYAAQFNPPTASVPFPAPTGEQIDMFMTMTDGEQREYMRIGIAWLQEQRRQERRAKQNAVGTGAHRPSVRRPRHLEDSRRDAG
jgi:hypothetical protein